jgi:hypothetical protein
MNEQPVADPSRHPGRVSSPSPRPRRSRGWVWFFVVLAVLAVAAVATLWVYNVRQQLTPKELAAARALWKEKGPRDYRLTIVKEGSATGTFLVTVRHGEVKSVLMKQEGSQGKKAEPVALPQRQYSYYDMDGLFDDLERFLEIKADPKQGRVFLHASFDREDGHLLGYIYSNAQNRQRVKVVVELTRLAPEKMSSKSSPES